MKWLATTFLCLLAMPAVAEQQASKVAIEILCYPYSDPSRPLAEKYREYPLVIGVTEITDIIAQQKVLGEVTLYLNPETGTYSLMFATAGKESLCMLNSGQEMRPARAQGQEM